MVRLRKSRVRYLTLAGLLVLAGTVATVAQASEASLPRVTFTGSATPKTCSSNPEVADLIIDTGKKLTVVNQTGGRATVFVGGVPGVSLDDGMAVRVKLTRGEHSIQLRPECQLGSAFGTLHVTVTRPSEADNDDGEQPEGGAESPGEDSSEPPIRSGPPSTMASTSPPAVIRPASPDSRHALTTAQGDESVSTGPTGGANSGASPSGRAVAGGGPQAFPDPEYDTFEAPYAVSLADDSRGVQVLALVALVCMLGVAGAIIRVVSMPAPR